MSWRLTDINVIEHLFYDYNLAFILIRAVLVLRLIQHLDEL